MTNEAGVHPKRAVVAAVQLPGVGDLEQDVSVNELRELAKTLGYEVVGTFLQKRANFDTAAYFGAGKREEIRRFVQGESEEGVADYEAAAVDHDPDHDADPEGEGEGAAGRSEKKRAGSGRGTAKKARHGLAAAQEAAKQAALADARGEHAARRCPAYRSRGLAFAGAQPGKRGRMRRDGSHHGDSGNFPPARQLTRGTCAGGDCAARLHVAQAS